MHVAVLQDGQVAMGPWIWEGGMNLLQEGEEQYFGLRVLSSRSRRVYLRVKEEEM